MPTPPIRRPVSSPRRSGRRPAMSLVFAKPGRLLFLVPLLLFAPALFLLFYRAAHPVVFAPDAGRGAAPGLVQRALDAAMAAPDTVHVTLQSILKQAATDDRTVILTTINEAWAKPGSIADIFLKSFRIGYNTRKLLDHLVIIALDEKAYVRCLSIHVHCVAIITEGVDFSGEKKFMTNDYLKLMWKRIDFLRLVLESGYNFIFSDADIMWLRDPFPMFDPDADFQIACDHFSGNSSDLDNKPNGGFTYVKSNNRTVEFYRFWHQSRIHYPHSHDQDVLEKVKYDPFMNEIGLTMRFLDTSYFGGLCEPSRDFNKVCTMHVNCCVGLKSKVHDLEVILEDWKMYMALPPNLKASGQLRWRAPQNCRVRSKLVKLFDGGIGLFYSMKLMYDGSWPRK